MKNKSDYSQIQKIYSVLVIACIAEFGYSLLSPYYPFEANKRNISSKTTGIIFSFFGFSSILFGILSPFIIQKYGKKFILFFSLIFDSITICFYGIICIFQNRIIFILLSCLIRVLEGGTSSILYIVLYSLITDLSNSENMAQNIGSIEMSASFGMLLSRFISGKIFSFIGYMKLFILFGLIELSLVLIINFNWIEDKENESNLEEFEYNDENSKNNDKNEKDLKNYSEKSNINLFDLNILFDKEILIYSFSIFLDNIGFSYLYPFLSLYLYENYDVTEEYSSGFYDLNLIAYFLTLLVVDIFNKELGNKTMVFAGLFLDSFFTLFFRPIKIFPKRLGYVIFGLFGTGIGSVFITLESYVEINKVLEKNYIPGVANDITSSLYNTIFYLGESIGPIIGGFLYEHYSFNFITILFSVIEFLFAFFYYIKILNDYMNLSKKNSKNYGEFYDNDDEEETKLLKEK